MLWLYGAGMTGILASFALRYPLRGNDDELQDIGQLSSYGIIEFVWYVAGMAALFALYLLALREARRLSLRRSGTPIFVNGAGLAAVMTWMYPVNAIDNFIYFVSARLLTVHHANPLTTYPQRFAENDPLMRFAGAWQDDLSPYGPLWNLIAAPISLLAGDHPGGAVFGFKLLSAVALLTGGWVIARTLGVIRPADAASGTLLYLWNPLVLWEGIGNGHNDTVLMVPVLLAFYAWTKRRDMLVLPLLILSALIKFATLPLVPLAAIALWRRDGNRQRRQDLLVNSTILGGVAVLVGFFPFYDLAAARSILTIQNDMLLHSPVQLTTNLLEERYGFETVRAWSRGIGQGIFTLIVALQSIAIWRRPDLLPRAAFDAMCVVLVVATWVRPWYGIWGVALAGLLPWGWPALRAIAWSAGGLALYALMIWIWHWWPTDIQTIHSLATIVMVGPFLAVVFVEMISAIRRSGDRGRPGAGPVASHAASDPAPALLGAEQPIPFSLQGSDRR